MESTLLTTNLDTQSTGSDFPVAFTAIVDVSQNDYFQVSVFNQTNKAGHRLHLV